MDFKAKAFGKRLQLARNMAGFTQQELAEKVLVDRKHISHLECGERNCSVDLLLAFSNVLDVSTDYLLKGSGGKVDCIYELTQIIDQLIRLKRSI